MDKHLSSVSRQHLGAQPMARAAHAGSLQHKRTMTAKRNPILASGQQHLRNTRAERRKPQDTEAAGVTVQAGTFPWGWPPRMRYNKLGISSPRHPGMSNPRDSEHRNGEHLHVLFKPNSLLQLHSYTQWMEKWLGWVTPNRFGGYYFIKRRQVFLPPLPLTKVTILPLPPPRVLFWVTFQN